MIDKTPIVTVINDDYFIGAVALKNSFIKNSQDGFTYHVIAYGGEELKNKLIDNGINNIIMNPDLGANLPCSYKCETPNPAMYGRLLIPDLFHQYKKSIYIDADSIILSPLNDLIDNHDMAERPCGGTMSWSPKSKEIIGYKGGGNGIMSSFIVYNHEWWNKKDIFSFCKKAMNDGEYHFKTVVQAVLQYVLNDDWYKYREFTQVQGGHRTTPEKINEAYILHFAGTNPWDEFPPELLPEPSHKTFTRNIWRSYL